MVFVQILPEAQRPSAARLLEAYEAALREQGRLRDDDRQVAGPAPDDERR